MRCLLDTNILVFLITSQNDELSRDVKLIIDDYNNLLFTSSVCAIELIQLERLGKFKLSKEQKTNGGILDFLKNSLGVEIALLIKSVSINYIL